jgi:hypothetical protein
VTLGLYFLFFVEVFGFIFLFFRVEVTDPLWMELRIGVESLERRGFVTLLEYTEALGSSAKSYRQGISTGES